MVRVNIEIEIPEYNEKYCMYKLSRRCPFLESCNYGVSHYCTITGKEITKHKHGIETVCRPYGCRCLIKKSLEGDKYELYQTRND